MAFNSTKGVRVDQALHGYKDGHALISSSLKLSAPSRRIMLILSDMSGPSMTRGFESYLTGYPLPDDDYYVFARTWHAPEMRRPGCVWSHSLILSKSSLGEVEDLTSLAVNFLHPLTGDVER